MRDLVLRSSGVQRTRALAQECTDKAKEVLVDPPERETKTALEVLAESYREKVLNTDQKCTLLFSASLESRRKTFTRVTRNM